MVVIIRHKYANPQSNAAYLRQIGAVQRLLNSYHQDAPEEGNKGTFNQDLQNLNQSLSKYNIYVDITDDKMKFTISDSENVYDEVEYKKLDKPEH